MKESFEKGIALGRKNYAEIAAKSDRWKSRHVPIYIRDFLFVPYYITESDEAMELHVIQPPIGNSESVHFTQFARSEINEEESAKVFNYA